MRRLELSDEEHARLLEVIARAHRHTPNVELARLHASVSHAPRVVAYCVSVELPPVDGGNAPLARTGSDRYRDL